MPTAGAFRANNFHLHAIGKRFNSHLASISKTTAPALIYRLTSTDPYVNLSIEHYIFQHVPVQTKVLLFYINRPCIVIGRNQNPWLEINLPLVRSLASSSFPAASSTHKSSLASNGAPITSASPPPQEQGQLKGKIDFVRRRSGGGTVFHDAGNVNWGVICNVDAFTRDKHAEMVVRGIQRAGVQNVRVNERHDIVLHQSRSQLLQHQETKGQQQQQQKREEKEQEEIIRKVSGSAYKLARGRALHHGTALCCSKNLGVIPQYLRSPAKSLITAKGVDSVRSPITNLDLDTTAFCSGVEDEFRLMYDDAVEGQPVVELGHDCLEIQEVRDGWNELQSEQWQYLQTPQFDFKLDSSSFGTFKFSAKHGTITSAQLILLNKAELALDLSSANIKIHAVRSWQAIIDRLTAVQPVSFSSEQITVLSTKLDALLGNAAASP